MVSPSTPASSTSTSTSTMTATGSSKRRPHSIGPRTLRLVEGMADEDEQDPTPLSSPTNSRVFSPGRRKPSVSYKVPDSDDHRPTRAASVSDGLHRVSISEVVIQRPNGVERPPLTLAEKHAELLHFIAQKESKCLELRTQLAVHEAELLQLKRKWERIVSRRYGGREDVTSPTSSSSNVLEGIKEGVQGVSRFLAAGLGEFSTPRPKPRPGTGSSSTSDVIMVEDTGATPTVQPNIAFLRRRRDCMRDLDPN